jgi:hypothetical protein
MRAGGDLGRLVRYPLRRLGRNLMSALAEAIVAVLEADAPRSRRYEDARQRVVWELAQADVNWYS